MIPRWVFVDEQRSRRARRARWSWDAKSQAMRRLRLALRACGVQQPMLLLYLWRDDGTPDTFVAIQLRLGHALAGWQLVGLGTKVQYELARLGLPYQAMISPTTRGHMRDQARYRAHVASVLGLTAAYAVASPKGPHPHPNAS